MPAIKSPATVLVTGASGFVAIWVVKTLLEAGYTVRGTVRSASKGDYLADSFKSYGDKFQYAIVEDIAEDGAFDEAVKGVDAVAHTASPFHLQADDPEEVIRPAVGGTVGILASVEKYGPNVQRIVITSSVAAVGGLSKPHGTIFTEEDWNTFSADEVEAKGKAASPGDKYSASKLLAEKAAWDYVENNKPKWDLATISPPMIFGPILHQVSSPASLNTSVAYFHHLINTKEGEMTKEELLAPNFNFVDVRDVALAHVRALEIPEAGGNRFIVAGGTFCGQDISTKETLLQARQLRNEFANDPRFVERQARKRRFPSSGDIPWSIPQGALMEIVDNALTGTPEGDIPDDWESSLVVLPENCLSEVLEGVNAIVGREDVEEARAKLLRILKSEGEDENADEGDDHGSGG